MRQREKSHAKVQHQVWYPQRIILTQSHKGALESVAGSHHCSFWGRTAEIFIFPHPEVIGSGQHPRESNWLKQFPCFISELWQCRSLLRNKNKYQTWEMRTHQEPVHMKMEQTSMGILAEHWHHKLHMLSYHIYTVLQGVKICKEKRSSSSKSNCSRR